MKYKIKNIVFILIFCGCSAYSFAQMIQHPPEPQMNGTSTLNSPTPCDPDGGGFENEDGSPITPPPGLCLPVNQYLLPLLIVGIALGAYKIQQTEKLRDS